MRLKCACRTLNRQIKCVGDVFVASPSEDVGIGLHEDVNLDTIMKTHTESDTVVWWPSVVHGFTGWKWGEGRRGGGRRRHDADSKK